MEIIKPEHNNFDFKRLILANPEPLQNSSYFTKITLDNNQPLFLQLPKCNTKQGILDVKGAKFCDLMYERSIQESLMNWLEQLEYACQDKLDEKKELWFQTELSRDDIESMMSPIMRLYQSGKYVLIRTSLLTQKTQGLDKSIAYNEQEINIDIDKLIATDYIVPLLVINGIKFSSRSFEIDIKLSQMMIFNRPMETTCLIKCANGVGANVLGTNGVCTANGVGTNGVGANVLGTNGVGANAVGANAVGANAVGTNGVVTNVLGTNGVGANVVGATPVGTTPVGTLKTQPIHENKDIVREKIIPNINLSTHLEKTQKDLNVINNNTNALEEVILNFNDIVDTVNIKKPNEVYYDIYRTARTKAKKLRKIAMEAYFEAKEIKTKFMLNDIEDSEESEESENSGDSEESEES